jgi:hypothetical protein
MIFSNFVLQRMALFIVFILARFYFSWLRFEFEYLTLNFTPTSIEIIKICFSFKAVIIIVSYSQVSTIVEQLLKRKFETENCKTVFKARLISSRTCVELYFNSTFLLSNNVFVCLFVWYLPSVFLLFWFAQLLPLSRNCFRCYRTVVGWRWWLAFNVCFASCICNNVKPFIFLFWNDNYYF